MKEDCSLAVQRFRTAAANFIETVDSLSELEREAFLRNVELCLAELYTSALYLPAVEPETETVDELPFKTPQWAELLKAVNAKIGLLDTYWSVFDSTEKESPAQGSLAGDISEIYYDLRHDFHLGETEIAQADLMWELRESFRQHWGRHAIEAMKAIHDLRL